MRKLLLIIFTCILLTPVSLMAQNHDNSFKVQYMAQAKENAAVQAKVTAALLCKKYSGDAAMEKALYQEIYQGKMEIEQTMVKYANTPELEGRLKEVIIKNDSLTQIYLQAVKSKGLVNNKILAPSDNSRFAVAIRLRNELSLTQTQVDSLMYHTNYLKELRISNADLKSIDYERDVLARILNDKQYTSLLVDINKVRALKTAKTDWKELKQRGLLPGADSVKTVNEMMTYMIGKFSLIDRYITGRYSNAGSLVSESMKSLIVPEPQATKILQTARKYNNPIPAPQNPVFRW